MVSKCNLSKWKGLTFPLYRLSLHHPSTYLVVVSIVVVVVVVVLLLLLGRGLVLFTATRLDDSS